MELTDRDKLYLALAETGQDYTFNILYYFLNITSIEALKEYNANGNNYLKLLQLSDGFISTVKHKIFDKDFDFQKLAMVRRQAFLLVLLLLIFIGIARGVLGARDPPFTSLFYPNNLQQVAKML